MSQSAKLDVPPVIPTDSLEAFIMEFNRIFSEAGVTWWINKLIDQTYTSIPLVYGTSIATNASLGGKFTITATNNTAFTIANPTGGHDGQLITYTIGNTSGGAMGAVTWGTQFKLAAWVNPANGFNRSITFQRYEPSQLWYEVSRTTVDVPN